MKENGEERERQKLGDRKKGQTSKIDTEGTVQGWKRGDRGCLKQ